MFENPEEQFLNTLKKIKLNHNKVFELLDIRKISQDQDKDEESIKFDYLGDNMWLSNLNQRILLASLSASIRII